MTVSNMSLSRLGLSSLEGGLIAVLGLVSLVATYWDDAWHTDIGRDSATIPPHLLLYGSVAVAGLIVAGWGLRVLLVTRSLAALLRQPALLLAAVGGGCVLFAAPIDAAWHSAFGRDAVLWSPPHMLVVFASAAMVTGVLSALRPSAGALVQAGTAGLLLGSLTVSVMEYDSDAPQFPEQWYLPVLLAAGLSSAALIRRLVGLRAPVVAAVAVYVLLRLAVIAVLTTLGRSTPALPIAVLGLAVVDLPWPGRLLRYAAGAAATSVLAWAAAVTGLASQRPSAVAVVAAPTVAAFVLLVLATGRRGRPLGLAALAVAVGVVAVLGPARPAAAHDPGQGQPVAAVRFTGSSDGQHTLSLTLDVPAGCAGLVPVRLLARRAGQRIVGALGQVGACRYTARVTVPTDGRWFTYAQLRQGGHDVEVWLPLQADHAGSLAEDRQLYRPATAGSARARAVRTIAGTAIYGLGLTLLILAIRQSRRASRPPAPPPGGAQ